MSIARTPDTPDGSLGPLTDEVDDRRRRHRRAVPAGQDRRTGESVGRRAFRGYYNDPEADAERMRGGVYHSGDLAYRDENGYVYFAGRLGDWMRVDGENLGTAPIERILLRHPDVVEVAVYAIPDARRRRSGDGRAGAGRGRRLRRRASSARSWPNSPISAPSSGRRSSGSAPRCRAPRRSRCSSASCRRRAPTAPTRSGRSRR